MARPLTLPVPAFPAPSFEPDDPFFRVLNRVKGEGRRRLLLGLQMVGTPLEALPAALVRENLTAFEHAAFETTRALELDGELLPDFLPGEVEAARVTWNLPDDRRVISLRARPHEGLPAWRLVDDRSSFYYLPVKHTPWPPTFLQVARLLDKASGTPIRGEDGLFSTAWKMAKALGWPRERVRRVVEASALALGACYQKDLLEYVDMMFRRFIGEPLSDDDDSYADPEEVVQ